METLSGLFVVYGVYFRIRIVSTAEARGRVDLRGRERANWLLQVHARIVDPRPGWQVGLGPVVLPSAIDPKQI